MSKYLDSDGLLYLWTKVKEYVTSKVPTKTSQITNDSGYITSADVPAAITIDSALSSTSTNPVQNKAVKIALDSKVAKISGKSLSTNDYTDADKSKLANIETNANNYTLPAATEAVLGGVTIGSNISVTSGKISLSKTNVTTALGYTPPTKDTTYSAATTSAAGLMSADDKEKLDGIAEGANAYTLPTATNSTLGGVKIAMGCSGGADYGWAVASNDEDGCLYVMPTDATTSTAGLMSASDKSKLNAFSAASNYALKTDITGLYKYKGSKATTSALPTSGNAVGDVWNVEAGGMNYVWTGSAWDALGEVFTIDAITNSEIDTIVAS